MPLSILNPVSLVLLSVQAKSISLIETGVAVSPVGATGVGVGVGVGVAQVVAVVFAVFE